jgi:hypothetical protein
MDGQVRQEDMNAILGELMGLSSVMGQYSPEARQQRQQQSFVQNYEQEQAKDVALREARKAQLAQRQEALGKEHATTMGSRAVQYKAMMEDMQKRRQEAVAALKVQIESQTQALRASAGTTQKVLDNRKAQIDTVTALETTKLLLRRWAALQAQPRNQNRSVTWEDIIYQPAIGNAPKKLDEDVKKLQTMAAKNWANIENGVRDKIDELSKDRRQYAPTMQGIDQRIEEVSKAQQPVTADWTPAKQQAYNQAYDQLQQLHRQMQALQQANMSTPTFDQGPSEAEKKMRSQYLKEDLPQANEYAGTIKTSSGTYVVPTAGARKETKAAFDTAIDQGPAKSEDAAKARVAAIRQKQLEELRAKILPKKSTEGPTSSKSVVSNVPKDAPVPSSSQDPTVRVYPKTFGDALGIRKNVAPGHETDFMQGY